MSVLSVLPTGTFTIDPTHSRIGFSARHAMVTKVRGSFNEYSGSGTVANGAASLTVDITASSLSRWNYSHGQSNPRYLERYLQLHGWLSWS